MTKQIRVKVPRKGFSQGKTHVSVETTGYEGNECEQATSFMDRVGKQVEQDLKPEYYGDNPDKQMLGDG